ncbi:MAG: MG2 domain-containing protein [Thermoplasmata archaeon]|nr:MG2 domain-containing protein [Thermoplasmata archaeon]
MNWRAALIVSLLLTSTIVLGSNAAAAPFTGTVILYDGTYHAQDYFEPSDDIYFDVTVYDAGAPAQYEAVNVVIVGDGIIGEVFNDTYTTDSYGQFSGYDGDDFWYTHDIGDYVMYVNVTNASAVAHPFTIYDAVPWEATGWTENYDDDVTDIFTEDQTVYLYFQVLDQFGNPFDGSSWDVTYQIMHNGYSVDSGGLATNVSGGDSEYYYTYYEYADQFGLYNVQVFNSASPPDQIGEFNFTVILPEVAIVRPQYFGTDRSVFVPGENVGYSVQLLYDVTETYDSDSYATRIVLFKQGTPGTLANDTLSTNDVGYTYDYYFYSIGSSDTYKGTYHIQVFTHEWDLIGSATFMVIDLDIAILPEKSVYAQGDEVVIEITTSLEDPYEVQIANSAHIELEDSSWNVPAHSTEWVRDYTMPNEDDGYYYVDVYVDSLRVGSYGFELKKFTIEARLSSSNLLPGQTATVFWRAVDNHDGGPISIDGETHMFYYDDSYLYVTDTLDDIAGSSGSFAFTVPNDAYIGGYGGITIDAEDSSEHFDSTTVQFQVGSLYVSVTTDRTSYRPGESVYMTFSSRVQGTSTMVPDVGIRAEVQHNDDRVGSSWTMDTNNGGYVDYVFTIPSEAADGTYIIIINATFNPNSDMTYDGTGDFTVTSDPYISLILYQEKAFYAPGDTVNVPYRVLRDGVETTDAQVSYEAEIGNGGWGDMTIALGFGSGGSFSISLPAGVEGILSISAMALTTDGFTAGDYLSNIEVSSGQLVLFTSKSAYMPGETINWFYMLNGDTETSAYYRILDPTGALLAEGTPTTGNFSYTLPLEYAVNPTAYLYVVGGSGTYIGYDIAYVYSGYLIDFSILSESYAPGDMMQINYTIIKIGEGPDEANGFMIYISIRGERVDQIWVTEMFGTLQYQIPADIRDGTHIVEVSLSDYDEQTQTVIIDSDAGSLAYGTIMGMNAGAFIVLILAIIALVIAIIGVVKFRKLAKRLDAVESPEPEADEPEAPEAPESPDAQDGTYPPPPPPEQYNP